MRSICGGWDVVVCCFFFKQKTAYEMRISDWSSDVCSSDLGGPVQRRRVLMALAKPQRQHRIVGLLAEQAVTSQAHLVELLAAEGVTATQATVSRDLEDLGAIKVRVAGGDTVYAIPEDRTSVV